MNWYGKSWKIATVFAGILFFSTLSASAQAFNKTVSIVEASAITGLSDGRFLVVDDEEGIFLLNSDLEAKLFVSAEGNDLLQDLEGITLSTDQKTVYCLSEKGGQISRLSLSQDKDSVKLGPVESLGNLPTIGETSNKGWEGICVILLGAKELLMAVHQEKPTAIGMFELPSLKQISICDLPTELKDLLKNLSDIAIDHRTGNLLLLSGKASRVIEVKATITNQIDELEIIKITKIKGEFAGKPEGICFDSQERLVIITDGAGDPGEFIRLNN